MFCSLRFTSERLLSHGEIVGFSRWPGGCLLDECQFDHDLDQKHQRYSMSAGPDLLA
jgi:hypothetical protein